MTFEGVTLEQVVAIVGGAFTLVGGCTTGIIFLVRQGRALGAADEARKADRHDIDELKKGFEALETETHVLNGAVNLLQALERTRDGEMRRIEAQIDKRLDRIEAKIDRVLHTGKDAE